MWGLLPISIVQSEGSPGGGGGGGRVGGGGGGVLANRCLNKKKKIR